MMIHRTWPWLAATLIALTLLSVPALGQSREELKDRFAQRYPKLQALKQQGKIGETWLGYVGAVKVEYLDEGDVRKLVDEENSDRRILYQRIADKEGTTREKVAERNAVRNFKKAKVGEYLKGPDGKWEKKKE